MLAMWTGDGISGHEWDYYIIPVCQMETKNNLHVHLESMATIATAKQNDGFMTRHAELVSASQQ